MKIFVLAFCATSAILSGCTSVPMADPELSAKAKEFNPPTEGNSGLYIYREKSFGGGALMKDIWVDDECIGETGGMGNFFYHEVAGGEEHTISTESEFSPNDLVVQTDPGELYFFHQYIKMGLFVGGANIEQVDAATGKEEVSALELAVKGNCSSTR